MEILYYNSKNHTQIIKRIVDLLKQGQVIAYPTDTLYGLAVDSTNLAALKQLYKVKERGFNKPVHVIVPSISYVKKIVVWDKVAQKLVKEFWPGPLTVVSKLQVVDKESKLLSAGTGFLGVRYPNNRIALDLAKKMGRPITTTGANPAGAVGGYDSYSADDIVEQFKDKKYKPDIIIDAGRLPKRKPSTLIKLEGGRIEVLRKGPITQTQIKKALNDAKI